MSDTFISSLHIQKLGHEILEIRERALHSITSKLDRGYTFDNDLARSRELLSKLFDWFLLDPCTCEVSVLQLIKRILQSESGKLLQKHYGSATIKSELEKIKSYIEPQYHKYIEDIAQNIDIPEVPPLISNVPLSYRSDNDCGSTATPFEGNVSYKPSPEQLIGFEKKETSISFLKWQSLIPQDVHVLKSVENSFRNPPDPSDLLNSCEFFKDILLQDFPAEVFLQRPAIVLLLQGLLTECPSTRIVAGVLECFSKLTQLLIVRIHFYSDPSVYNNKVYLENVSERSTPSSEDIYRRNFSAREQDFVKEFEYLNIASKQQLPITKFCFSTMICLLDYICDKPNSFSDDKVKFNRKQNCVNSSLRLLQELVNLLALCPEKDDNEIVMFLQKFADTLEYFRIDLTSSDCDPQRGVIYLFLLHICTVFLKGNNVLLPMSFKIALGNILINPIVSRLYPELHDFLLEFLENCDKVVSVEKYKTLRDVCNSMTAAVQLLEFYKTKNFVENVDLAKNAILSLQFHKNLQFLKTVVEIFATKMPSDNLEEKCKKDMIDVVVSLLSHHQTEIRQEMYALCQQKVVAAVGPKLNVKREGAPGTQILFLLQPEIINEIALNGLSSESYKIQASAEAILIYIIKCKILVSNQIWQQCIEAIIPALSILLCYADKETAIGRTITGILDPDVGKSLLLTNTEILRGNIELLFAKDAAIRSEGISRILWLLALQEDARDLIPKMSQLQDKNLQSICQLKIVYDVNKNRNTQHYYEPSNLKQVLRLLDSENVEPMIRRSALTQIGVMMEDYLLHRTFIDNDGLRILLCVMKSALTEQNYQDYPDAIVPAISILKLLCLYNASIRHELCCNLDVYCFVLRGLFLYFTEEHVKEDCSVVLFLLLFHDHVKGCPSNGNFSMPSLIFEKLKVPFSCQTYTRENNEVEKFVEEIFADAISLNALQVHWNLEWFGGFENVLKWDTVDENNCTGDFDDKLLLTNYGLLLLKNCSLEYCAKKYLIDIQNSTTHLAVLEAVTRLTSCVNLYNIIGQTNKTKNDNFYYLPWEKSFKKFLTVLPSGEADSTLLTSILKFLSLLIPLYKLQEPPCWITTLIKNPKNCLLDILDVEVHSKSLAQELLNLLVKCVQQEQNFLLNAETWGIVFKTITTTLKLSDTQHFYNLAFLDCVLQTLVHVTGTMGWSFTNVKETIFQTTRDICELLSAFHCGKGVTATESVMGLSVTRHLLLLLNHLLAEMLTADFKDWEVCFLEENDENESVLTILVQLLNSRDVVLRAAVLQLFAGLCVSPRIAIEVVTETMLKKINIYETAITVSLDNEEASVVRENSMALLTNLCSHMVSKQNDEDSINKIRIILNLLEDYDFYKQLKGILSYLYLKSVITNDFIESNSRNEEKIPIVTPGLVRAITKFVYNLTVLCKEEVICNLQEIGLIKLFFRSLSLPSNVCKNTKELAMYRDVLEMNTQICALLNKSVAHEKNCLSILLHTRDCLNLLLSFLNPQLYHTYLPELVYLRNKLWYEIFNLLTMLVANETESVEVITNCLTENYKEPFLETLCEAITNQHSEELQQSALTSLTSLLNVERKEEQNSVHYMLDSFRSPRSFVAEKNWETKYQILEQAFFETTFRTSHPKINNEEFLLAGAEICKILLHLYHITTNKKRSIVIASLTSLLAQSKEAKTYAFTHGLLEIAMQQIRELHIKLSLETVECMRRIVSKKRVSPLLRELDTSIGLLTNFMLANVEIKNRCADLGFADLIHKLWIWFCFQKIELVNVLQLLCTFTIDSLAACQSLTFTSAIAGSGPRKTPSNQTLLHAIINLINKEMEQITRTHDLKILKLCLEVLQNVSCAVECRIIMAKGNLFGTLARLHPAITKRQKPWDYVEFLWLEFLQTFTAFAEGQAAVAKIPEVLDLIITLTMSAKIQNRIKAVFVLRNIAFYQPNRPRLLISNEFLNVLCLKLEQGTMQEKNAVVSILWILAANNQKAKLVLKCAQLDDKLQEVLKQCHISAELNVNPCDIQRMHLVLKLLRDNDK